LSGVHASDDVVKRFVAEAETIAKLKHPNIIQIHAIGDHEGTPYVELEYADGGNLSVRMDGKPWSPVVSARLIEAVARAIHEAHKLGIVHRDLKPANLLLTSDGCPKITDFGLAKILQTDSGMTRTESVLGSPCYMAPEQAEGHSKDAGPMADVYALGANLYELITGRPPFVAATVLATLDLVKQADPVPPSRLVPAVPRDLETICLKCLQKDPAQRYGSALELADDLSRFLKNEPIQARRASRVERLRKWVSRRPCARVRAHGGLRLSRIGSLAKQSGADSRRGAPRSSQPRAGAGTRRLQARRLGERQGVSRKLAGARAIRARAPRHGTADQGTP
jgi:serine/threonine protein kinase